jgi:uncharacterized membrane protein YkvA (DUF1232 family)
MRTVKDLRKYLEQNNLSPERFGEITGVSNMTWRRLLTRPDNDVLADKYQKIIEVSLTTEDSPVLDPKKIVQEGLGKSEKNMRSKIESFAKGISSQTTDALKKVQKYLSIVKASSELKAGIKILATYLKSHGPKAKYSLMTFGALAYFINPADLIADTLISVGLIDDMGVIYFVRELISKEGKRGDDTGLTKVSAKVDDLFD